MEHEFRKLRSANRVAVRLRSVGDWYEANPESRLFRLAERAVEAEWGQKPLYVREGGTMPVRSPCMMATFADSIVTGPLPALMHTRGRHLCPCHAPQSLLQIECSM